MKLALISFTQQGAKLNREMIQSLKNIFREVVGYHLSKYKAEGLVQVETSLKEWTKEAFNAYEGIVYISATGIAVRAIAPFIISKDKDPAIVVTDELGRYVIALLSGHLGGANNLARRLAHLSKGQCIISTATDLEGRFAVDAWAKYHHLILKDLKCAKNITAALLQGEVIGIESTFAIKGDLPEGIAKIKTSKGIFIGLNTLENPFEETLHVIPQLLTLGIGCRKGTAFEKIDRLVKRELETLKLSIDAVKNVCSIDLKKEEVGLIEWANKYNKPIHFYTSHELKAVEGVFTPSAFVQQITHVDNVCERSAVKGSDGDNLILRKTALEGVTLAIAQAEFEVTLTYK